MTDTSETGFTHSVASDYGTLYFNSTTGAWKFDVDNDAVNALSADTSLSFAVTASDDEGLSSAPQPLVITITAANDTPVMNAIAAQSIIDTSAYDSFATSTPVVEVDTATETTESVVVHGIRFTVIQEADTAFDWRVRFEVSAHNTSSSEVIFIRTPGGAGNSNIRTFVFSGAGLSTITYSQQGIVDLVNSDSDVSPRIRAEIETVMSFNYNAQSDRDVFITSANFVETSVEVTGDVEIITSSTASEQVLSIGGVIKIDHDNNDTTDALTLISGGNTGEYRLNSGDSSFLTEHGLSAGDDWWVYTGTYGTFVIRGDGSYSYVLNAEEASRGTRVDDTVTVNVVDAHGTAHQIVVTVPINHVDDATKEGVSLETVVVTYTGNFSANDADADDTAFTFDVTGNTADTSEAGFNHSVSSTYGTLYYHDTSGAWKFVVDAEAVNALSADTDVTFSVTATDDGGLTSDAVTLTINITAANDGPVIAANAPATASIAENADGSGTAISLVTVTATDAEGDTVTYSLDATSTGNGFAIDANTGEITYTGSSLDHETTDSYTLIVTATSSGGTATHTVTVSVTDEDEGPVFGSGSSNASIAENNDGSGSAVRITAVTATDEDGDAVTYSLDDASVRTGFAIDANSGEITYTGTGLDREEDTSHSLVVTATSSGGTATHTVTVTVNNVNEAPVFDDGAPTEGTIAENQDGSSTAIDIVTVTATDPEGHTVSYSLDATSTSNGFAINASSGDITYTGSGFDLENDATTYTLTVTATASGGTDTHTVTVTVTDDDEPPAFSNSTSTGSIAENADGSATAIVIKTVTATDPDGDDVTYTLDDASIRNGFAINASTGAITYTGEGLDREDATSYSLVVTATSSGGSDTHTVTVTVTNVNEGPVFDADAPTEGTIAENRDGSSTAIPIVTVTATDEDGDTVSYSLDATSTGNGFAINSTTGAITYTGSGFNFESGTTSYTVTVTATAGGDTTDHVVTVTVTDVDEAPTFSSNSSTASIAENNDGSGSAVTISTVTATDPDGDTVTYRLDNASIRAGFEINASTGAITYTGTGLDREDASSHSLTVTATSSGGSATHTVTVSVTNVNEGPSFATDTSTASVAENADGSGTGIAVTTVTATDPEGHNITYSLDATSTGNGFAINASTGAITYTGTGLDYETENSYTLVVTATSSSQTDTHTVTVSVENVDEGGGGTEFSINDTSDTEVTIYEGDHQVTGQIEVSDSSRITTGAYSVSGTSAYGGTIQIDADTGEWTYVLSNADSNVSGLDDGDTALTDTFTITVTYDTDQDVEREISFDITITIEGRDASNAAEGSIGGINTRRGTSGDEIIQGGNHNDVLRTDDQGSGVQGGNDLLIGGYGADVLHLGTGTDTVVYRFASTADSDGDNDGDSTNDWVAIDGGDTVNNFERGKDKLILLDTDGTAVSLAEFLGSNSQITVNLLFNGDDISGITITFPDEGTRNGDLSNVNTSGNTLTINFSDVLTVSDDLLGSDDNNDGNRDGVNNDGALVKDGTDELTDLSLLINYFGGSDFDGLQLYDGADYDLTIL